MNQVTLKDWLRNRAEGILDNVVAALLVSCLGYVAYILGGYLPRFFSSHKAVYIVQAFLLVVFITSTILIWKRRAKIRRLLIRRSAEEQEVNTKFKRLFVNRKSELEVFRACLDGRKAGWQVLGLSGVGGVGKSWLLRMYKLICEVQKIPVALIDLARDKSPVNMLITIAQGLKESKVKLLGFDNAMRHYDKIVEKVQAQEVVWKSIAQSLERTSGLSEASITAALEGFLGLDDIALYRSPEVVLQKALLEDLSSVQNHQPIIILLFDTFEQAGDSKVSVTELLTQTPLHVKSVIAGRSALGVSWKSPNVRIKQLELRELSQEDTRKCLNRYQSEYLDRRLAKEEVNELVGFAQGLPLAISWAVDLMARYGIGKFAKVRSEVVGDLVEISIRGVRKDLQPVLEVCAMLHWFNEDALQFFFADSEKCSESYRELRKAPYIRVWPEGLALHDRVREYILEDLKQRSPKRYKELGHQVAEWFAIGLDILEKQGERFSQSWRAIAIERIRCLFISEDNSKWLLFRRYFMEGAGRGQLLFCQELLSSIPPRDVTWAKYYEGRLAIFLGRFDAAVRILEPLTIEPIDELLLAYILDALGPSYYNQGRYSDLLDANQRALEISRRLEPTLMPDNLDGIGWAYHRMSKYEEAVAAFSEGLGIAKQYGDTYWMAKHNYNLAAPKYKMGLFDEASAHCKEALMLLSKGNRLDQEFAGLVFSLQGTIALEQGKIDEADHLFKESLKIFEETRRDDRKAMSLAHIGDVLASKGLYLQALQVYKAGQKIAVHCGQKRYELLNLIGLLEMALILKKRSMLEQYSSGALELAVLLSDRTAIASLEKILDSIKI